MGDVVLVAGAAVAVLVGDGRLRSGAAVAVAGVVVQPAAGACQPAM